MFKIIKILLLLTLLGVFTYFVYPVIKTRYFNHPPVSTETYPESFPTTPPDDSTPFPGPNENIPENSGEPFPSLEDSLSGKTTPADSNFPISLNERGTPDAQNLAHITTEHCDNNCDAFSMDFELLEYCQQVCGIAPIKTVSDCDDKKGIEKDYCLKDLAVTKKDSKLCDPIKDANLKLTCQNRILEDSLENQPAPTKLDF